MRKQFRLGSYFFFGVFLALFMSSCGQEPLQEGLSERDVNKILVVLSRHGIEASKDKVASAQDVSFSVLVSQEDLAKARQILTDYNLPRERNTKRMIEEICTSKDVISSPEWEKCREIVSKQGQISQYLEGDAVPAVVKADVIISPPKEAEFAEDPDPNKKTTASAAVRMIRTDSEDKITEEDLKRYISSAVDGLAFRDVSVIISYIDDPQMSPKPEDPKEHGEVLPPNAAVPLTSMLGLEMLSESAGRLKIYLIVFLVLFLLMAAFLVLNVIKMTKLRQELKVSKSNMGEASLTEGEAPPSLEAAKGSAQEEAKPEIAAAQEEEPPSEPSS